MKFALFASAVAFVTAAHASEPVESAAAADAGVPSARDDDAGAPEAPAAAAAQRNADHERAAGARFGSFGSVEPSTADTSPSPVPTAPHGGASRQEDNGGDQTSYDETSGAGVMVRQSPPVGAPGLYFAPAKARSGALVLMLRPEFGIQAGLEQFSLPSIGAQSEGDITVSASSRLRYPVATAIAGGALLAGVDRFSLEVSALTNVVNPWGTLLDQDYLSASSSTRSETIEFSHTDSRATLRFLALEGVIRFRFADLPRTWARGAFHAAAGFRCESSAYSAYGANGWQLDSSQNRVPVSVDGDPLVGRYDVHYYHPFIGAGIDVGEGKPFSFGSEMRILAGWSTHQDDHVLRNKHGYAASQELGFSLLAEPAFTVADTGPFRVLLGFSAQLQLVASVAGRFSQAFYGDDPSIPGEQLGEAIPDTDFSFLSIHARLLLFAAARF